MKKYFFIAASEKFLTIEEPLEEILKERRRNYKENKREIDFWLLKRPLFLKSPQFQDLYNKIPKPQAAVVSNDKKFIIFLKLRMEFVASGEFDAPSLDIVDPLAEEK